MRNRMRLIGGAAAVVGCVIFAEGCGSESKGSNPPPKNTGWAKTYGGTNYEYAFSAQQTIDGGYFVAGSTSSFGAGNSDLWALKISGDGGVAWQKAYGGANDEYAFSVRQTTDGGYIVAGRTGSFGVGSDDLWVLKISGDGGVAWQKAYGGAIGEVAYSIQQTSEGGYIVAGGTYSFGAGNQDIWVLKLNGDGSVAWQKTYGGAQREYASSISQTTDGGYIVAGTTTSFGAGNYDIWVLRLNGDGSVAWQKTYGGTGDESPSSIQQTADGGYIVAGGTSSYGAGNSDFWVLKLNGDGGTAWQRAYGGVLNDYASSISQTTDGGYIVAGSTYSFGAGNQDICILKLNANGGIAWQKVYGGIEFEYARFIQQTAGGDYIAAGNTDSFGAGKTDVWLMKLPADGGIAFTAASGAQVTDTTAILTNTLVVGQSTSVVPSDTSVSAVNSSASSTDTAATIGQQAP